MLKLHRTYKIEFTVEKPNSKGEWETDEILTVQNPITCNFSTELGMSGQANLANIQFINLNKDSRASLRLDMWNFETKRIFFSFYAGYGYPDSSTGHFSQSLIFKGRMMSGVSTKASGAVDWVTDIQAIPSDIFSNTYVNATFSGGTSLEDVLNYMVQRSTDLKLGYVTPDLGKLTRNKTFIGQPIDLISREYGGYEIFVDRGQFNILGDNDVVPGDLSVITDASGLLGTPKRAWQMLELEMLFEPQLKIGQAVSLDSKLMPELNQAYKVMAINHSGTISERTSGKLVTKLTLFSVADTTKLRKLEPAKPVTYKKEAETKWTKPVKGRVTDNFGWRLHPLYKKTMFHAGLDIGANYNVPIYAPADGKVNFVGWQGGYGRTVQLDNGQSGSITITSLFGHMNRSNVRMGEQVYKGKSIIGYVGSTGNSTGPHLHFEVRENGKPVNPEKYVGKY